VGRCAQCGAWGTLQQSGEAVAEGATLPRPVPLGSVSQAATARYPSGVPELDRVLGGGVVPGALILVGGDPGIGKSTLLLQAMGHLANARRRVLYLTAEESAAQVRMRADRLGMCADEFFLLADTRIAALQQGIAELKPAVAVVDSVQTVSATDEHAVGSVHQIRAVTHSLLTVAKRQDIAIFVVGHVTKEGAIAGPKLMEHMVDTVLYFEGERTGPYRILRAHKNRFGASHEIGVFEMGPLGLVGIDNPSELFLAQRAGGAGSAVVTSIEGSRPILLEVQALATPSPLATPRRSATGVDSVRVGMLAAVLGAKVGIELSGLDLYVNLAGGVRVREPATDLGIALALASVFHNRPVAADTVVIGEVGLGGEVRAVSDLARRLQEAESLGFRRAIVPEVELLRSKGRLPALELCGVATLAQALDVGLGG
jgi:DNA repair protein RadA/Sms